ncbi:hypothetical protein RIF29_20307 [Crotalaria pallida]|uniref:Uncharacterized protein n=1 Tax=Crotalaria pallida TaxID=3830 RepID=A0AAN9F0Z7_CROPI
MICYFCFVCLCLLFIHDSNCIMVLVKKFKWLTGSAGRLPQLIPDQILKLKQLTVLTLDDTDKIVGHSLGDGTAALLTYILREQKEFSSSTLSSDPFLPKTG